MRKLMCLSFVLLLLGGGGVAGAFEPELVEADLLPGSTAIVPGRPLRLALRLRMRKEWHVYWKNPGEAGQATRIDVDLPKGFELTRIDWPLPRRFEQPGGITGYGYKKEAVFIITIDTPEKLYEGQAVRIGLNASWLACLDTCIPGEKELSLRLPVRPEAEAANREIIEHWLGRMPRPLRAGKALAAATIDGRIDADGKGKFSIRLEWREAPARLEWYPESQNALQIDEVKLRQEKKETHITFRARIFRGMKLKKAGIDTLVIYEDAEGKRHGITLPVLLTERADQVEPAKEETGKQ